MAAEHTLILKGTGYGVVPSSRFLPNSASFLMLSISSMHLGFPFLLLLPFLTLLPFGGSLPVPFHESQCCCFSFSFLCDCFLALVSLLLLCQLPVYLHASPALCLWHWLTISFQFIFLCLLSGSSQSSESLNKRTRRALATLNSSTKDDIGSWSLDETLYSPRLVKAWWDPSPPLDESVYCCFQCFHCLTGDLIKG